MKWPTEVGGGRGELWIQEAPGAGAFPGGEVGVGFDSSFDEVGGGLEGDDLGQGEGSLDGLHPLGAREEGDAEGAGADGLEIGELFAAVVEDQEGDGFLRRRGVRKTLARRHGG